MRWQHPSRGLLAPGEFIAIAEDSGQIEALGRWVLQTACAQLASWSRDPDMARLRLSVNISVRELRDPRFVQHVLGVLERSGAPLKQLKLELTESMMLENFDDTIAKMNAIRAHGVGFSLDDFGTGYASLTHLKRLPLDCLKVDRSFVRDLLSNPRDAAIARTIVALGHNLDLIVVAEGVETEAQRDLLQSFGCQAYQGYLFGAAAPVEVLNLAAHSAAQRGASAPAPASPRYAPSPWAVAAMPPRVAAMPPGGGADARARTPRTGLQRPCRRPRTWRRRRAGRHGACPRAAHGQRALRRSSRTGVRWRWSRR